MSDMGLAIAVWVVFTLLVILALYRESRRPLTDDDARCAAVDDDVLERERAPLRRRRRAEKVRMRKPVLWRPSRGKPVVGADRAARAPRERPSPRAEL